MSATLHRDFRVFRMNLGLSGGLFPEETVIVISDHCEKNVYPHEFKPCFDFIGAVGTFMVRFIPEFGELIEKGLCQPDLTQGKKEFSVLMNSLFESAGCLEVRTLHELGCFGYSFPADSTGREIDSSEFEQIDRYGKRYARMLTSQRELTRMIEVAYKLFLPDAKHVSAGSLWMEQKT